MEKKKNELQKNKDFFKEEKHYKWVSRVQKYNQDKKQYYGSVVPEKASEDLKSATDYFEQRRLTEMIEN